MLKKILKNAKIVANDVAARKVKNTIMSAL
jgi:hypothetical protein